MEYIDTYDSEEIVPMTQEEYEDWRQQEIDMVLEMYVGEGYFA